MACEVLDILQYGVHPSTNTQWLWEQARVSWSHINGEKLLAEAAKPLTYLLRSSD